MGIFAVMEPGQWGHVGQEVTMVIRIHIAHLQSVCRQAQKLNGNAIH